MRYASLKLALPLSLLVFAPGAEAATFIFETALSGAEENPPVATPGSGFTRVTIDDATSTMRIEATFANLIGTTTAAHIHCCAAFPGNASPATVLVLPGFPTGVMTGTMDQTYDMTSASSYNPAFVTANGGTTAGAFSALLNGLINEDAYFNIHTSAFGGGEIRGQLAPVPEPSAWAMMLVGFGVVGAAMRSARRKTRISISRV